MPPPYLFILCHSLAPILQYSWLELLSLETRDALSGLSAFEYVVNSAGVTPLCCPLTSLSFPNSKCIRYSAHCALSHNTGRFVFILELKLYKSNCILVWLLLLDYKHFFLTATSFIFATPAFSAVFDTDITYSIYIFKWMPGSTRYTRCQGSDSLVEGQGKFMELKSKA